MKAAPGRETGLEKDGLRMSPLIVSLTTPESVAVMFFTSLSDVSTVSSPIIDSEGELNVKLYVVAFAVDQVASVTAVIDATMVTRLRLDTAKYPLGFLISLD